MSDRPIKCDPFVLTNVSDAIPDKVFLKETLFEELEPLDFSKCDLAVLNKEFVIPAECGYAFGWECPNFKELCLPDKTLPRRHKKKRINKKWAKRYGYINVYRKINIKDVSVIPNEDGYDFVGGYYND